MKVRIMLAAILASLLTGMLLATGGTGLKTKTIANPAPRLAPTLQTAIKEPHTIDGQNLSTPAKPQNVTAENGPADSKNGETNFSSNSSMFQPVPSPDKTGQPSEPVPGRIHQPGLFPIFYDDMGDPSGLTYASAS
jgi:hypothetical protein